jgi:indolepyruvate decarboxylase
VPTRPACGRGNIAPNDIATAVNDLMAEHGKMPIASDMGDCLFTAMDIEHTALVAPGYYATMGFGVPAGLGLQAATGQRPLILVGDGAFQMTGWELGNCQRYGWDPIVLVFNNASWEMLRTFQPESSFNDLGHWGYAEMAGGLGGDGVRVHHARRAEGGSGPGGRHAAAFQLIDHHDSPRRAVDHPGALRGRREAVEGRRPACPDRSISRMLMTRRCASGWRS